MKWFTRAKRSEHPGGSRLSAEDVATRCAALLRGGLQGNALSAALLREIDREGTDRETAEILSTRLAEGASLGEAFAALPGPEWRVLGCAWVLAETSGAPIALVLDRIAEALHDVDELSRRRDVLLAGPQMTVRLIGWLPAVALGLGVALGLNPLPILLTPFGALLLVTGVLLQVMGVRWAQQLTAGVAADDRVSGLECELAWIALAGGAPPSAAIPRIANVASDFRAEWIEFQSLCAGAPLDRALSEAERAGVPASGLLHSAAREARAHTQARMEREAERLGVRILIPLAVCILPAFLLLGVVPVVFSLLGGLVLST